LAMDQVKKTTKRPRNRKNMDQDLRMIRIGFDFMATPEGTSMVKIFRHSFKSIGKLPDWINLQQ